MLKICDTAVMGERTLGRIALYKPKYLIKEKLRLVGRVSGRRKLCKPSGYKLLIVNDAITYAD